MFPAAFRALCDILPTSSKASQLNLHVVLFSTYLHQSIFSDTGFLTAQQAVEEHPIDSPVYECKAAALVRD